MPDDNELFSGGDSKGFLRRFLWVVIVLMAILCMQSWWVYRMDPHRLVDKIGIAVVALVGLFLLERKGYKPALRWVLWAAWLVIGVETCARAGLRNSTVLTYPLFVILAGWLLGRTQALWMTAATVTFVSVMAYGQSELGWLPAQPYRPWITASVLIGVVTFGALISVNVADNIRARHRELVGLNLMLEQRVAERTAHLAEANEELEAALRNLQRTQRDLAQAERLASLGSLVAGVAHELNTPIGNALMASSTLTDTVDRFGREAAAPTMRRAAIGEFVANTRDLSDLIQRSAQRAGDLIASFKRMAVSPGSEKRTHFDLRVVVLEVLQSLAPTLSAKGLAVKVEVAKGIAMDSYQVAVEQVLTNLLTNVWTHAFDDTTNGQVVISARLERGTFADSHENVQVVQLSVEDDGKGIALDALPRVFDPFFTTRLGQGGSGLGLAIAHTLVTGILGGSIRVDSAPGSGARFTLQLPCVAGR